MPKPLAVVVDDDPQQLAETVSSIEALGFQVIPYEAVAPARELLFERGQLIDVFVLDRKLPMKKGESESDELGDVLFREVSTAYPDARILVFSGYTDFDHLQETTSHSGVIEAGPNRILDRVSVYRKQQTDLFDLAVAELRDSLRYIERIAVHMETPGDRSLIRVLRRVALQYGGTSLRAQVLAGGLTQAAVLRCEIFNESLMVASVVIKVGVSLPSSGGIQDLLPRHLVASRVGVVSGLMFGRHASVLQLAGEETTSLFECMRTDDSPVVEALRVLRAGLDELVPNDGVQDVRLLDLLPAVIQPSRLVAILAEFDIAAPDLEMWVTTRKCISHLDLHLSNVLLDDGVPVLIDSEDSGVASAVVDPLMMLMSSWIHPDSPLFDGSWPIEVIDAKFFLEEGFTDDAPHKIFFGELVDWVRDRTASARELWAFVLGYAARQTTFPNVRKSARAREWLIHLMRIASEKLAD